MRARRWFCLGMMLAGLGNAGCLAPRSAPFEMPGESIALDLAPVEMPRVARAQLPEPPPLPKLQPPTLPPKNDLPPLPPPGGAVPVSLRPMNPVRMTIRAHVNGRPIFDDEVMLLVKQSLGASWREIQGMSERQRAEKIADLFNQARDKIIEDEVMYQDAVRKLEKINPRVLDKLKGMAGEELEKIIKDFRTRGMPEDDIREVLPTWKKHVERSFIATEYVRSRVWQQATSRVGPTEIQDYYDTHRNEFQTVDKVQWQDLFVLVGGKNATNLVEARRFAEDLIAMCRTGNDFVKLAEYDDGDAKLRGGEGIGQRKEDIRPAALADTLLRMKEGQMDIVDIGTGVHLVRVVKREYAGPIPLNDKTQKEIRRKLTDQIINREYQRIVRELKQRSVIEIEQVGG